jgi:hypothetical protein
MSPINFYRVFNSYLIICSIIISTLSTIAGQDMSATVSSRSSFSKNQLPFWLTSNKNGLTDKSSSSILISSKNQKKYEFGLDLILTQNDLESAYLNQFFFIFKKYPIHLEIGSKGALVGPKVLSTGSLVESGNAVPIPKVKLSFSDYRNLSINKIKIQYKANIAHGLIHSPEYTTSPYLHEKSLDLKKNISNNLFLNIGLHHMAIWGGETIQYGKLPSSINDYLRIFFALPGGEKSIYQEKKNSLGNHLGAWNFSLEKKYNNQILKFYMQHPFEDESGARWVLNKFDGLYGINLISEKSYHISSLIYEYINTMNQSGSEGASDSTYGWDNYYNHYIYQSGWTNKERVIGNPLLTLGSNKGRYSNGQYIINNRIKAHHFGFKGAVSDRINYRILFTYSKNFGTYPDEYYYKSMNIIYAFDDGLIQRSGLIELIALNLLDSINVSLAYGFDNGELLNKTDSFMLKINHKFETNIRNKRP